MRCKFGFTHSDKGPPVDEDGAISLYDAQGRHPGQWLYTTEYIERETVDKQPAERHTSCRSKQEPCFSLPLFLAVGMHRAQESIHRLTIFIGDDWSQMADVKFYLSCSAVFFITADDTGLRLVTLVLLDYCAVPAVVFYCTKCSNLYGYLHGYRRIQDTILY